MYEIICPSCRKMVDVAVHVAVAGSQFKCPKCWAIIEVANDNPLKLVVSKNPQGRITHAASSSRASRREEFED